MVLGRKTSVGQAALLPVHLSRQRGGVRVKLHWGPARQTSLVDAQGTDAGSRPCNQTHFSSTSQMPADARHVAVLGLKSSAGQAALLPVHLRRVGLEGERQG